MLNSFSTTRKRKMKRIQRDRRVTINLTNKNNKNYRCIFCNNKLKLIKKFNFVTTKNFVKLITKNKKQFFKTIKNILNVYQNLNKETNNLQIKITLTTFKKKLKNRTKTQKQKIKNLFKKQTKMLKQIKNFEKTIKTKKIAKICRFRNVYKNNFEKINVKIKSLIINKKTLKKIIDELKKRFKHTKFFLLLNSNKKKQIDKNSKKTN